MKEKDIRDRIAQFLKRTARTVAVPASMGLGLSGAGCDHHALAGKVSDAGPDLAAQTSDASPLGPDVADAATDLPQMMVPYMVALAPDAGPDLAADLAAPDLAAVELAAHALDAQSLDADRDAARDAFEVGADLRPDLPFIAPPYLAPLLGTGERFGVGVQGEVPDPLAAPEKK